MDSAIRLREAICPPWCAGHVGSYQAWEVDRTGIPQRDHGEEQGVEVGPMHVSIGQIEYIDRTMSPASISIWLDYDSTTLTPGQARELAAALLAASDRAEADR